MEGSLASPARRHLVKRQAPRPTTSIPAVSPAASAPHASAAPVVFSTPSLVILGSSMGSRSSEEVNSSNPLARSDIIMGAIVGSMFALILLGTLFLYFIVRIREKRQDQRKMMRHARQRYDELEAQGLVSGKDYDRGSAGGFAEETPLHSGVTVDRISGRVLMAKSALGNSLIPGADATTANALSAKHSSLDRNGLPKTFASRTNVPVAGLVPAASLPSLLTLKPSQMHNPAIATAMERAGLPDFETFEGEGMQIYRSLVGLPSPVAATSSPTSTSSRQSPDFGRHSPLGHTRTGSRDAGSDVHLARMQGGRTRPERIGSGSEQSDTQRGSYPRESAPGSLQPYDDIPLRNPFEDQYQEMDMHLQTSPPYGSYSKSETQPAEPPVEKEKKRSRRKRELAPAPPPNHLNIQIAGAGALDIALDDLILSSPTVAADSPADTYSPVDHVRAPSSESDLTAADSPDLSGRGALQGDFVASPEPNLSTSSRALSPADSLEHADSSGNSTLRSDSSPEVEIWSPPPKTPKSVLRGAKAAGGRAPRKTVSFSKTRVEVEVDRWGLEEYA